MGKVSNGYFVWAYAYTICHFHDGMIIQVQEFDLQMVNTCDIILMVWASSLCKTAIYYTFVLMTRWNIMEIDKKDRRAHWFQTINDPDTPSVIMQACLLHH